MLELIRELPSPRRLRRLGLGVLSIEPGEDLPDFTPLLHRLPDGLEELRILHSKAAETGAVLEKLRNDLPAAAAKGILYVSSVEQVRLPLLPCPHKLNVIAASSVEHACERALLRYSCELVPQYYVRPYSKEKKRLL